MSATTTASTPFGTALRRWRRSRGTSQLALAHRAQTTSRHLSFLETGRSRPSRAMVSRLCDALELPLREANDLFRAAGLSPAYPETLLSAQDLAPFQGVIDRMLAQHAPYPAYVVDRHWNIVRTNAVAEAFLPEHGDRNAIRLTYVGAWRQLIANWEEIAGSGLRRLQSEAARHPDDEEFAELVSLAAAACTELSATTPGGEVRMLCPHFRVGDRIVRTISVVAQFGAARDVTLDELRLELIWPADADAEEYFRTTAAVPSIGA